MAELVDTFQSQVLQLLNLEIEIEATHQQKP
jgi:hypothetical protein